MVTKFQNKWPRVGAETLTMLTSFWEPQNSAIYISKVIPSLLFLMEGMLNEALKTRKYLICQFQELDQMGSLKEESDIIFFCTE